MTHECRNHTLFKNSLKLHFPDKANFKVTRIEQKKALGFRIFGSRGIELSINESEGVDLRLCFRICKMQVFS